MLNSQAIMLCFYASTTSYYALDRVLLCSINRLGIELVINLPYILLTDFELSCDTCVHVLSLYLIRLVNRGASDGSTVR